MFAARKFLAGLLVIFPFGVNGIIMAEAAENKYTIKMATVAPEESYWGDFAQKLKFYIEGRSRGRVKVIWYFSGVMGDEPEVAEKVRAGKIAGAVFTVNGLGVIQPAMKVLMLPLLFRSYEEVDYILDSMFPRFRQLVEERGYMLLGFTELGFGRIFSRAC